jgi:uncharacterized protein (DUF849 family)
MCTTGHRIGSGHDRHRPARRHHLPDHRRLRVEQFAARPELASLDCGSMNFGEAVFITSLAFIDRCAREMRAAGVKPEIECFEAGMVAAGARLVAEEKIDSPALFQVVLGVRGGAPTRVDTQAREIFAL